MAIRILLVDDHKIIREGLRALIEKDPELQVVGEAENGRTAVKLAQELKPDVVVMDVALPDLNGIEATRMIHSKHPDIKILALSVHSEKQLVVETLKAGALGYLIKDDCGSKELGNAIRTSAKNESYLNPKIARTVIDNYVHQLSRPGHTDLPCPSLTPMERRVLQLLAEGKTTKQIASCFYLSVKTIETHRKHIMDKLDIHSIAGLTRYAIREKLILP